MLGNLKNDSINSLENLEDSNHYSNIMNSKRNKFRTEIRNRKTQFSFNQKRFDSLKNLLPNNDKNFNFQITLENLTLEQQIFLLASNLAIPQNMNDFNNLYHLRCYLMDIYQTSSNLSFGIIMKTEIPSILIKYIKENTVENTLDKRMEASRCLLILTAGSEYECEILLDLGIIDVFIDILDKSIEKTEYFEIIVTILANLCYCDKNKQIFFEKGIVAVILNIAIINNIDDLSIIRSMLYFIKCLTLSVCYDDIKYLLDPLIHMYEIDERDIKIDILSIIAQIGETFNPNYINKIVNNEKFMLEINESLKSEEKGFIDSLLTIISNITFGNDPNIKCLFTYNIVLTLINIIQFHNFEIQRKIIVIFTNVLKENDENFHYFYKNHFFDLFPKLLVVSNENKNFKQDFLELLFTCIYSSPKEIIHHICTKEIINVLFEELRNNENNLDGIIDILSLIEYLMKVQNNENNYYIVIISRLENGILDQLEYHSNNMICNIVFRIKELFYIINKKKLDF